MFEFSKIWRPKKNFWLKIINVNVSSHNFEPLKHYFINWIEDLLCKKLKNWAPTSARLLITQWTQFSNGHVQGRAGLGVDKATESTYLLDADRATGSTYLWAYISCVHFTSVRQSRPVIQSQISSLTLLSAYFYTLQGVESWNEINFMSIADLSDIWEAGLLSFKDLSSAWNVFIGEN